MANKITINFYKSQKNKNLLTLACKQFQAKNVLSISQIYIQELFYSSFCNNVDAKLPNNTQKV